MQKRLAVKTSKVFLKELDDLPTEVALKVTRDLKILEVAPLPLGKGLIKKLKGFTPPLYRMRIGNYRVLYRITGNEIAILRIIDRKELERELKRMIGSIFSISGIAEDSKPPHPKGGALLKGITFI
ncbi:MAG: type II toxin-antitoxin system RelE/ParE family toxin [Nitrospirota bacterium]